ncbi:MAG: glycosyltransferase [Pseudomonadales bacterium]
MTIINILHVTFDMAIGGTEQVIRHLITNLDREKYNCSILCIDGRVGEIGKQLQADDVNIHCLERQPGFDTHLIGSVRHLIREHDVQIVHCHQYTPYVYGLLGSIGTGAKVFFTEHGRFYPDIFKIKRALVNPLLSLLTTEITAISAATKNALIQYERLPSKKIGVIYNGILQLQPDADKVEQIREQLEIGDDERIIGTVSRLDSIKNHPLMLEACKSVLEHHPKTRLLIVGDGPTRGELESHISALQLQDRVVLTGYTSEPENYLSLMEVYLLSSFSEGMSMTLLEAMSLSIPCVVTDVGGNGEVVEHGKTGIVVPNNDLKRFTDGIQTLLGDKALLQAYGKAGRRRFQREFTSEKMAQSYSLLYEKQRV